MERNSEFSVYPNQSVRISLHVLYWLLMGLFALFVNWQLFNYKLFRIQNILYIYCPFAASVLIHYILCYITLPHARRRKWVVTILSLFLVYLFFLLTTILSFKFLANYFGADKPVLQKYQSYNLGIFLNLFSYESFILVLSITIWYNTPGIIIKMIKDFYESSMEKLAIAQEKNAMEVVFLRGQIQPHFLFNSLNSIYGMVLENEEASKVVLQLSNLLRFSLYDSTKENITLKEEVEFLSNYIVLEKMRHKESRVQIECDFSQVENVEKQIKPLILINFVENAFKHGVNASIREMWVKMVMTEKDGLLTFHIANNKPLSPARKKSNEQPGGLGLKNVRRRLELEYHTRHSLDIKETQEVYEVALVIKL